VTYSIPELDPGVADDYSSIASFSSASPTLAIQTVLNCGAIMALG
jgi:hypothetical protein